MDDCPIPTEKDAEAMLAVPSGEVIAISGGFAMAIDVLDDFGCPTRQYFAFKDRDGAAYFKQMLAGGLN